MMSIPFPFFLLLPILAAVWAETLPAMYEQAGSLHLDSQQGGDIVLNSVPFSEVRVRGEPVSCMRLGTRLEAPAPGVRARKSMHRMPTGWLKTSTGRQHGRRAAG